MRRLFKGGHYSAQLWDCAAPIRGRLLNRVRRLFDEIRYIPLYIILYNKTSIHTLHMAHILLYVYLYIILYNITAVSLTCDLVFRNTDVIANGDGDQVSHTWLQWWGEQLAPGHTHMREHVALGPPRMLTAGRYGNREECDRPTTIVEQLPADQQRIVSLLCGCEEEELGSWEGGRGRGGGGVRVQADISCGYLVAHLWQGGSQ